MKKILIMLAVAFTLLSCVDNKQPISLELELANPNGSKLNSIRIINLPPNFVKAPESEFLNNGITDAVTQTNVKVLGEAPAESLGMIYNINAEEEHAPLADNLNKSIPAYISSSTFANDILSVDCSLCNGEDTAEVTVGVSFILGKQTYKGVIHNVKFNGA
mgnify:CR=1 FL=1